MPISTEITSDKLDVNRIITHVSSPNSGAISVFIGTTKNHFNGKKVVQLEYEAYKPMAEKEMNKLCENMLEKWPLSKISMAHRIGIVPVGEASVVVAAASEHRKEAQEAVMWGIDALKSSVPIWKKEIYENGDSEWKENAECCFKQKI